MSDYWYHPVRPAIMENDLRLYAEWRAKTSAPAFLWVYYPHPLAPALIDRWKRFPHVMVHRTAQVMGQFIREGVRAIFECGEQDQVSASRWH